mmetsp:Transcript_5057/g.12627  ORF Transcript_5057/g.12627 Transcript_5057/m.12627 type:complete len:239 (-) Transcript_5057:690-1406(-)
MARVEAAFSVGFVLCESCRRGGMAPALTNTRLLGPFWPRMRMHFSARLCSVGVLTESMVTTVSSTPESRMGACMSSSCAKFESAHSSRSVVLVDERGISSMRIWKPPLDWICCRFSTSSDMLARICVQLSLTPSSSLDSSWHTIGMPRDLRKMSRFFFVAQSRRSSAAHGCATTGSESCMQLTTAVTPPELDTVSRVLSSSTILLRIITAVLRVSLDADVSNPITGGMPPSTRMDSCI